MGKVGRGEICGGVLTLQLWEGGSSLCKAVVIKSACCCLTSTGSGKGRWMKSGRSKADWSPQQAMQPPEDALKPMSVLIDSDLKWCGHPAEARAPVTELNTHTPYLEVRGA